MLKVIEILAESDRSWEDAAARAARAVEQASKTLHGIKSLYIKNMEAKVSDNKLTVRSFFPKLEKLELFAKDIREQVPLRNED